MIILKLINLLNKLLGVEDSQSQSHLTGNNCESCGSPLRGNHFNSLLFSLALIIYQIPLFILENH